MNQRISRLELKRRAAKERLHELVELMKTATGVGSYPVCDLIDSITEAK